MKKITVFKEETILAVDMHQREIPYGCREESEYKTFGDEPIVTTKEDSFVIHELRKGLTVSRINYRFKESLSKAFGLGFKQVKEDQLTVYLEKSLKFIIINKDLNELIKTSLESKDQSTEVLEMESLKELIDCLQARNNTLDDKNCELHKLVFNHQKQLFEILNIPWYKRFFGFKKSINLKRINLLNKHNEVRRFK